MADQSSVNTTPNRGRSYPPGYGTIEPVANYRPWDVDHEFQDVYSRVREHTMVDIYRLWLLWTLAGGLNAGVPSAGTGSQGPTSGAGISGAPETGPGDVATRPGAGKKGRAVGATGDLLEVGSWRGGSGAVLAAASRRVQGRRVFLADTFSGVVKAGTRDTYYKGGEHSNTSPEIVGSLIGSMGLEDVELLVGTFPDETGHAIEGRAFALCHIDVDVYQSARDAFTWVWPRLVQGGVVVFDDYGFYGCEGVTACVEEIWEELGDGVVIPNLTGQAVIVKSGPRGR